jgi:tight adherence protein C
MGYAIAVFCIVLLLIASGGLLLFYREAMHRRIFEVINPKPKSGTLKGAIQRTGHSIGGVLGHFENLLPRSQAEVSVIQLRLTRAGYREAATIKIFYGSKILLPFLFCAIAFITGLGELSPYFVYMLSLVVGFLGPDYWLGWRISARQRRILRGLPDVLDLLTICIEAGLSLDQAGLRASQELRKAQPELCDELGIVVLEQRAGRPRAEAWKHMGDRTDVDSVRHLANMLVQAEQFGTSVAKTLRVHSDTLRTKRIQAVEEKAAKLSVKLVFPLALFIFPSLFVVALGPAIISMMDSFKMFKQ